MFCRPLWHHPKNPPVQFGNIRKSIPTPRNLLSTALASPEKCFSAILENSEVASSTSELVVDCFCVCEHSAKARATGLRSARTDIVVFLAFISKSRSGGCPAAQGLEMKAIFTSRIFQKKKKTKKNGRHTCEGIKAYSGEGCVDEREEGGSSGGLTQLKYFYRLIVASGFFACVCSFHDAIQCSFLFSALFSYACRLLLPDMFSVCASIVDFFWDCFSFVRRPVDTPSTVTRRCERKKRTLAVYFPTAPWFSVST